MTYNQIVEELVKLESKDDEFYQPMMVVDSTKYRGRGRPRKSDYTEFGIAMMNAQAMLVDRLNTAMNDVLLNRKPTGLNLFINRPQKNGLPE